MKIPKHAVFHFLKLSFTNTVACLDQWPLAKRPVFWPFSIYLNLNVYIILNDYCRDIIIQAFQS